VKIRLSINRRRPNFRKRIVRENFWKKGEKLRREKIKRETCDFLLNQVRVRLITQ